MTAFGWFKNILVFSGIGIATLFIFSQAVTAQSILNLQCPDYYENMGAHSSASEAQAYSRAESASQAMCLKRELGEAIIVESEQRSRRLYLNPPLFYAAACFCCEGTNRCGTEKENDDLALELDGPSEVKFEYNREYDSPSYKTKEFFQADQAGSSVLNTVYDKLQIENKCGQDAQYSAKFLTLVDKGQTSFDQCVLSKKGTNCAPYSYDLTYEITCISDQSNSGWVFMGHRIANHIGPPTSINTVATEYGYHWLKKNSAYSDVKNTIQETVKSANDGAYIDWVYATPQSYNVVGIFKITEDVGTWAGPKIEATFFKMFKGQSTSEIEARISEEAAKLGYKSYAVAEWINIADADVRLGDQTGPVSGN